MTASFVKKDGRRLLVVRPKDAMKAKELADRAVKENFSQEQFDLILAEQPYTVVGFLGRGVGGRPIVIDKDGRKLGEPQPWDSFVGAPDDATLDTFKPGDPFAAEKTEKPS